MSIYCLNNRNLKKKKLKHNFLQISIHFMYISTHFDVKMIFICKIRPLQVLKTPSKRSDFQYKLLVKWSLLSLATLSLPTLVVSSRTSGEWARLTKYKCRLGTTVQEKLWEITVFREASRRKRAERVLEKKFCLARANRALKNKKFFWALVTKIFKFLKLSKMNLMN